MSIFLFTKELNELLDKMDIPDNRRNDIPWLSRNLGIRNSNHPDYSRASNIIKAIMKSSKGTLEERIKLVAGDNTEWLLKEVQWYIYSSEFEDSYDNADNFRFADMSNSEQMNKLERNDGCCGQASWTFRHPSGKYYLMAWNYGH